MAKMTEDYTKAMAKSYSNQVGRLTIPASQLDGIVEIPLGFQPMGIASQGDRIAIAAYFEPAICQAQISRDNEGLHFDVNWIRGVNHGIQSVRLFPDIYQPGGANRAQTVNFGPEGTLWVTRNGERDFFILSPPQKPEGRWALTGRKELPGEGMVHSAHLHNNKLLTIESALDLDSWCIRTYTDDFALTEERRTAPYLYGIWYLAHTKRIFTITDFRSLSPKGIYVNDELALPNIWGNGICLTTYGVLVTKYGQAAPGPFNGEPGGLIFIPNHLLPK